MDEDHHHINDLFEDMDRLNALYEELMWPHDVELEFTADYENNRIIISLIGDGPSILKEVSMVGNDMMLDPGIGTCGKAGQGVPVGVAQPSILINKMTVGGTKL